MKNISTTVVNSLSHQPPTKEEDRPAYFYAYEITESAHERRRYLRQLNIEGPHWSTRDKRVIPYKYMRESHVINAFKASLRDLEGKATYAARQGFVYTSELEAIKVRVDSIKSLVSYFDQKGFDFNKQLILSKEAWELYEGTYPPRRDDEYDHDEWDDGVFPDGSPDWW